MGEAKQYTGAELKAWRERLGKDEAWAAALLESLPGAPASAEIGCGPGQGALRLHAAESVADGYAYHAYLRKTLHAALEAEEARQAAERAQAEPVCPEGVTAWRGMGEATYIGTAKTPCAAMLVRDDGTARALSDMDIPCELLEYAAAVSRANKTKHAEGDRQRKLDAVRAAEEALEKAHASRSKAEEAVTSAAAWVERARREAGL